MIFVPKNLRRQWPERKRQASHLLEVSDWALLGFHNEVWQLVSRPLNGTPADLEQQQHPVSVPR
jgi:hypothetical protein